MNKNITTTITPDKNINMEDILYVLSEFVGESVTLNYGTIYGIECFENFDCWLDGINNDILVLYNDNGSERQIMIRKEDLDYWNIDGFQLEDNIHLYWKNGNWMQIYMG
jgi:hypothetical protein